MTDNEARAREYQRKRANAVLLDVFCNDQAAFSAADVAIVATALDEAEARALAAANARVAGLEQQIEDAALAYGRSLAIANARVAELEKLLKPFANSSIVERFEGREDEMPLEADETITLGDFRRAARLLGEKT